MPYKNKEEYNTYLRDYMRKRRAVKPVLLNPIEYETVVIGGVPYKRIKPSIGG